MSIKEKARIAELEAAVAELSLKEKARIAELEATVAELQAELAKTRRAATRAAKAAAGPEPKKTTARKR